MTIYQLMLTIIVSFITALPLCNIAKKAGFKGDWWVMFIMVIIPFIQLIYLYLLAFKKWHK